MNPSDRKPTNPPRPGRPGWLRIPAWLAGEAPDLSRQAARVRIMERNIVLPVKAGMLLLVGYYLFFSGWFDDVYTFREAVLLTVRLFFLIYLVISVISGILLGGMDELPFKFTREVVLMVALVDVSFLGAMTAVTGGFESMLYWVFIGLIVRNAVSIPATSTQVVLNLLMCACFVASGLLEVEVTSVEEQEIESEAGESAVLRILVLLLLTACAYGIQVLFEKQRSADDEAQEFAQRQQQLQSAGRLAAEIAHQLKNPLGIINNAAFTLQRTVKEGKTITQQIQIIREEVERSDRIITELMGYARLAEGRVERLEVPDELDQAIDRVFPKAVKYNIQIDRDYAPALPTLMMQRGHLSEVLVNILQNAREAMNGQGRISVSARAGEDASVIITVRDDGPGIAPAHLRQVFEPYFTTKDKGTGLGLAIARHNTEIYGGAIRVESELGKGTAFTLKFPARSAIRLRS